MHKAFSSSTTFRERLSKDRSSLIRVGVRDVPWRSSLGHEAQPGEVVFLALDLLIFFWVGRVITRDVKVAQGSTRSVYDLLEILLLVSEAVLLLVVTLVAGVVPVGVVVLVGGVELLPLGAVGDEVVGAAALEAAPGWPPPLLAELMQGTEVSCHQGNLIVGMLSYCSSEAAARDDKVISKEDEMVLVGLAS
jgi:hypothetical protein